MSRIATCLMILVLSVGFALTPKSVEGFELVLACAELRCDYDCTGHSGSTATNTAFSAGSCWTWGLLVACGCSGCTDSDFLPNDSEQECVCN